MLKSQYFDICEDEKNNFENKFGTLKIEYLNVLKNYNYKDMRNMMRKHNVLIVNTIKKVLKHFPEFNEIKHLSLLTGSLARGTNLLYSDIDISIMYENKYREKYLKVEDLLSYMLTDIFSFRGRDRIHGITYYLPKVSNIMQDEIINNKYKLYFDDGKFEYKVRENAYDTMDTIWNASRSVDDLENYLINNQTTFKEWADVYEPLEKNVEYDEFNKKIMSSQLEKIKECNFYAYKNKFIYNLENQQCYELGDTLEIRMLKKIYKIKLLDNIYDFMTYLYKLAVYKNLEIDTLNFEKMQNHKILEKLNVEEKILDDIYYMFCLITKLQYILNIQGLDLSKHSTKKIYYDKIRSYSKNIFNDNDLIKEIEEEKNKLYENMANILRGLRWEIK